MAEPETILVCAGCGATEDFSAAKEGGWVVGRNARPEHGLILLCPRCAKKEGK